MGMVEPKFVKIHGTGLLLLPIRVYPGSSVVEPSRETLHFTPTKPGAKLEQQQLARFE
jgi:hypothetical protein